VPPSVFPLSQKCLDKEFDRIFLLRLGEPDHRPFSNTVILTRPTHRRNTRSRSPGFFLCYSSPSLISGTLVEDIRADAGPDFRVRCPEVVDLVGMTLTPSLHFAGCPSFIYDPPVESLFSKAVLLTFLSAAKLYTDGMSLRVVLLAFGCCCFPVLASRPLP